ncbi:MAG: helix-turn-helix domain-containing protein [Gammaproteobacteria bacterium]|nr:helix-turn-helix domain-containing protein [Gammaproteobacteria bacterium]
MQSQTYLTLGQAAQKSGKSKSTLSKALKTGRLSYVKKVGNQYRIDPAELHRVFPLQQPANVEAERMETQKESSTFQLEIDRLREQLARERETVVDLRSQLDAESSKRRKLAMMLADQPPKKSFFDRLLDKYSHLYSTAHKGFSKIPKLNKS